jgi:hypothetical protein
MSLGHRHRRKQIRSNLSDPDWETIAGIANHHVGVQVFQNAVGHAGGPYEFLHCAFALPLLAHPKSSI